MDTMNFYNRLLKMGKLRGKSLGLERVKVYELGENPFVSSFAISSAYGEETNGLH